MKYLRYILSISSIVISDFKSILLILATVILYLSSLGASFSLYGAIVLLFIFVISTIESILTAKNQQTDTDNRVSYEKKDIPINIGKFLGGALGIVFGAEFLVDSATELAVKSGISQAVISATIVQSALRCRNLSPRSLPS